MAKERRSVTHPAPQRPRFTPRPKLSFKQAQEIMRTQLAKQGCTCRAVLDLDVRDKRTRGQMLRERKSLLAWTALAVAQHDLKCPLSRLSQLKALREGRAGATSTEG